METLLKSLGKQTDEDQFEWEQLEAASEGSKAREVVESLQQRCMSLTLLFQAQHARLSTSGAHQENKMNSEEQRRNNEAQTHSMENMHKSVNDQDARREEEKILNWLSPTDYAIYHSDIARRRQLGTGEWLLKLNEFKSW